MQSIKNAEEAKRIDAIIEEASKLSFENQKYILETIKAMIFTKKNILQQNERK